MVSCIRYFKPTGAGGAAQGDHVCRGQRHHDLDGAAGAGRFLLSVSFVGFFRQFSLSVSWRFALVPSARPRSYRLLPVQVLAVLEQRSVLEGKPASAIHYAGTV